MDTGIIATIGAVVAGLIAAVVALLRSNGKKEAQLDEAARKAARDAEQARRIDEAIAQRRDADELSRTSPIADIDAHDSMRGRQRD